MTISAPERPPAVDPLATARAAKELAEIRLLRVVVREHDNGRSQVAIADALGVSQAAISKMLVRARLTPEVQDETPWEVALRYAAGELTREQMLDAFAAWPWTFSTFLDLDQAWPEQFVRGSWEDVGRAVRAGYLSEQDYEVVFERTA